ncbi:hypothetical protein FACS189430_00410 [Bacteroidia bacterium]|nr:hypothetical protein FACS189430_00410 [Bacteroidia bacterium]
MKGFLEQTAEYLHRVYGEQLEHFCIVFPNVRAGLFFKEYLARLSTKPVWSPAFRSVSHLMEEITGWTPADRLTLVFDLYQAFREHKTTEESFEDFYFWGEMLLDDFDDIDKNLVDAGELFRNIHDLKEIDQIFDYLTDVQKEAIRLFWQDFNDGKTELKENFSLIWGSLSDIYQSFKKRLSEKSFGYEGMLQREAVKRLTDGNTLGYEKFVFIGFNALTQCEKKLFKSLQKRDKALFFWDVDDYYLNNDWHEAGAFLRDNIREFPSERTFDKNQLTSTDKRIEVTSVPSETGQANVAAQIIEKLPAEADWVRTAVALPDEHLLLPVLSAIPETMQVKDINITMGYPFVYSPANSLFERLASLQIHIRRDSFYHQDVRMILNHPYIRNLAAAETDSIIADMLRRNRIYVAAAELNSHPLLKKIFRPCTGAQDLTAWMMDVITEIAGRIKGDDDNCLNVNERYQLEYLYVFYTTLQRMADILTANETDMEIKVFMRLLRQIFASVKIPFKGEPLKGLQVMGMLETRSLDFDTVIVLSMNEGMFPKPPQKPSFIPYSLRKGFGLPLNEEKDAISAYLFYRLIQRASVVHLIYNSTASDRNTGEMSRYISQLQHEPVFSLQKRNLTFSINLGRDKAIVKERTAAVQQILQRYRTQDEGSKFLSPTAVNAYLDCRLQFYFKYIEGLRETDEILDEIDPSIFGKLLHATMENLYKGHEDISIETLNRLQNDRNKIRETLLAAFGEHFFHEKRITEEDITGRNIIIRDVLLKYIGRIIEVDKAVTPFKIISLEDKINVQIPVTGGGVTVKVNLQGAIDRLEKTQDKIRIIDYKTGAAKRSFPAIEVLFDRNKPDNHAAMQTLLYACITMLKYPHYQTVSPCLYVVKELFTENFDPRLRLNKVPIDDYQTVAGEFESKLNSLLSEIFLSDIPFDQTEDEKKCRICPYAGICHRD